MILAKVLQIFITQMLDLTHNLEAKDTDDLTEGSTNLYYTDARAQAVSINNILEDTSPQLGGNLDINSSNITGIGNIDTTGDITITSTSDGSTAGPINQPCQR